MDSKSYGNHLVTLTRMGRTEPHYLVTICLLPTFRSMNAAKIAV